MFTSKRGISVWISWVLVMALAVAIGTFFFGYMRDFASETVDEVVTRSGQIEVCDNTAIRLDGFCQNTQTLNINVSNNGNLRIEELLFRMFDIYGQPEGVYKNVTIDVGKEISLIIVKQGVTKQVAVIPVVTEDSKRFICQNRKAEQADIKFC